MKYNKCLLCGKEKTTKAQKRKQICISCSNKQRHKNKQKKEYTPKNKYNLDKIRCAICGYESVLLLSHLFWKHNINGKEYEEKYGMPFRAKTDNKEIIQAIKQTHKKTSKRCVEYWIDQGFTKEEAVNKVKEHQANFSYEKCIKKYGEVEGKKVFLERQKKWISSLSKLDMEKINKKKSNSLTKLIKNNKNGWFEKITEKNSNRHFRNIVGEYPNIDCFTKQAHKKIPWKTIKRYIYKSKIFREFYNISKQNEDDVYISCFYFLENEAIKIINQTRYGTNYFYNGFLFRSFGEVEIAHFLFDRQIKFCYDKKYPNLPKGLNIRYDFYLQEFDYYIEYIGLANKVSPEKDKVVKLYKSRLSKKIDFIDNSNIKCLISFDVEEIKSKILELLSEKKDNDQKHL